MSDEIITGKENILAYLRAKYNVHSWDTVKRWKKKGLPIRYLESHAPFVLPDEVILWAVTYDELTRENKK